jgi:hypothetical protein
MGGGRFQQELRFFYSPSKSLALAASAYSGIT